MNLQNQARLVRLIAAKIYSRDDVEFLISALRDVTEERDAATALGVTRSARLVVAARPFIAAHLKSCPDPEQCLDVQRWRDAVAKLAVK